MLFVNTSLLGMNRVRRSFSVEHPFITVAIVSICGAVFQFAVFFSPLNRLTEKTLEKVCYEIVPLVWAALCGFIILRSIAFRILNK